ncbi:nicotinate-nucleotide--dimethylbenzimidazole phosphoribosyltransferase [Streptomyces sp. NPDC051636]|uniref:nicotinate-nucleotide--dimethylbenzimidazole phosphoribosyltransferase n=1 Tax=Streptomyces sp. NPDC051636 TaxID=3365663 RepID=UPI00378B8C2F
MTDTGQVPGEGLPESAGMVEQPGVPAHGAYTYLSESTAEDEDLLLPGAQGAWGNEVPPPPPEPVLEAVHEPGPHETDGRDSGSVDLGGVRLPDTGPVSVPPSPILSAPHDPAAAPSVPRRPLHLGPPIPDASASPVRSLADRGPAGAPARQPGPPATGPEYLDAQPLRDLTPQGAAPWGAAHPAPAAQVSPQAPAAETVAPAADPGTDPSDAAQAAVARLATQAATAGATTETAAAAAQVAAEAVPQAADAVRVVTGHEGVQVASEQDGTYAVAAGQDAEGARAPEAASGPEAVPAPQAVPGPETAQGAQAPQDVQETEETLGQENAQSGGDPHGSGEPVAEDTEAVGTPEVAQDQAAAPGAEDPQVQAVPAHIPDAEQITGDAEAPEAAQAAEAVGTAEAAETADASQTPQPVQAPDVPAPEAVHPQVEPVADAGQPVAEPLLADAGQAHPAEVPQTAAAVDAQAGAPAPEPARIPEAAHIPQAVPAAETPQAPAPAPAETPQAAPAPAPVPAPASPEAESTPAAPEDVPAPAGEGTAPQVQGPQLGHTQTGEQGQPAVLVPEDQPRADEAQPRHGQGQALLQAPTEAETLGATAPVTEDAQAAQPHDGVAVHAAPTDPAVAHAQASEPGAVPATAAEDEAPGDPAAALPGSVPPQPEPDQPLGRFVPVQGTVPTAPHLAPTPPHPIVVPPDEQPAAAPTVPAPRAADTAAEPVEEPDPEVVQHVEDLETRAADQEEGTAAVAEARQSTGPAAPGYNDAEREAVLKVMRERRDIRNGFRSDPIPHEVLLRVLEAAHTAPSVGHSQPWDFVVIRSAETRRSMHELAMRQREAYAKSLPKGRAKQFKELKIEAILDTPVNIVVTADPTRGGRHTLGRHTQPQMAPYSAALAVENLWLAARAEGLGVGWVSFFDEREMVRALGLPEHLEVIAYLCVGYVDEFPDEPELMQAGWSKRRPLSWVVHEETYGRRALPGEDPHDLLAETVAQIRPLDAKALGEAWERQKRMTKPAGALGMLEIISAQLSGLSRQCPPPIPEPAAVAIFAGDHGVHAQGVTPWPQEVTAQMVANFLGGGAVCNAFAGQVGAEVCVVDVGVAAELPATPGLLPRKIRAGTSDMTTGPAMTREEAKQAIEVGIETARDLVAAGNKALLTGEMGIANTTASAALISVYTGADPAEVTGRGTGINDETLARKTEVVRRALDLHKPDPADPIGVLAAIGGFEHAAMVGLLLGGASLRTPVILDGVSAGAAALVARAIAPEVLAACVAGHRSAEPGHVAALNKLGLRPLVDLDLRLGEGTGALLALPLVQSTARAMHEVATFDSAGVTEK